MFPKITACCPFCGMQPETEDEPHAQNLQIKFIEMQNVHHYWVECYIGCGARGPFCSSSIEAVEEWNKRVILSEEMIETEKDLEVL